MQVHPSVDSGAGGVLAGAGAGGAVRVRAQRRAAARRVPGAAQPAGAPRVPRAAARRRARRAGRVPSEYSTTQTETPPSLPLGQLIVKL